MKYSNNGDVKILSIYLNQDSDIFNLKYKIDDKESIIVLSNKGYYNIYLGHFNFFEIEECEKVDFNIINIDEDYEEFYEKYNIELNIIEDFKNMKTDSNLYSDLDLKNPSDLYMAFKRILNMAHHIKNNNDDSYIDDLKYALFVLFNKYYNGVENYTGNWWFYEIGIPKCINEILILVKKYFTEDEIYKYLNTERFYIQDAKYIFYRRNYPDLYREEATYANLADNIYICLLRAILQHNKKELDYLFDLVSKTIKYTNYGDGFYIDGGFIQHNNIPYTASYGEVLLNSVSKIIEIFYLIGYDCQSYVEHIYTLIHKSFIPFLYDGKAVESVRGRAVSRVKKNSGYSYRTILSAIKRLNLIHPNSDIEAYIKNEEIDKYYEDYSNAYNSIDRFIFRNNNYLISINANSKYIANYESINGENLLGDYSSNFTYELIFKNKEKTIFNILRNPYYRCGSTNSFIKEEPNITINNKITAGVSLNNYLNTCYHQNGDVKGYFSKIVMPNSILAIGSEINSENEYISSIYSFDNKYEMVNGKLVINDNLIINTDNEYKIETIIDHISPYDININQSKEKLDIRQTRVYIENPKDYEYQIYPYYLGVNDDYKVIRKDTTHVVCTNDYLFINSFEEELVIINDISFKGRFSAILHFNQNEIQLVLSTGKRSDYNVLFKIDNYDIISSTVAHDRYSFIIEDEYSHEIIFRRNDI